jgi:HK97 family phage major capsid protein
MPDALKDKLDEISGTIEAKRTEAQEKFARFEQARDDFAKAGADANNTESEEFKKAHEIHAEYGTVADEIKGLEQLRDGVFSMLAAEGAAPSGPHSESIEAASPAGEGKKLDVTERITSSDAYKKLKDSGALNTDSATIGHVPLFKASEAELKALLVGTSSPFITPDREPYVPQPKRPMKILDLITIGSTGVDSLEYARQKTWTNAAVEVAEATALSTGTKPEATIEFEKVTASVKTIAHWIPATRRALADIPQLQTIIDSQLQYGLQLRLENEIVAGNGSGENLTGITNTSGILTQARSSDTNEDALFKGITQLRLGFIEPNGIGVHPINWQAMRLRKASTAGTYILGNPQAQVSESLWGLPVAVTAAFAEGTGVVADFSQAVFWLREGIQVLASDSHSDFFIKNLVAVLAEMRGAFGIPLPAAFCKVTELN